MSRCLPDVAVPKNALLFQPNEVSLRWLTLRLALLLSRAQVVLRLQSQKRQRCGNSASQLAYKSAAPATFVRCHIPADFTVSITFCIRKPEAVALLPIRPSGARIAETFQR
jgi:hypothetical protein